MRWGISPTSKLNNNKRGNMTTEAEKDGPLEKAAYGPKTHTPLVRTSYAFVTKKDQGYEGKPGTERYKITGLIPHDRAAELKPLKLAMLKLAKEQWGNDTKWSDITTPFNDGDEQTGDSIEEAYKGHIYFTAKTSRGPIGVLVGKNKVKLKDIDDQGVEDPRIDNAGYYAVITVTPATYVQNVKVEKEVNGKKKVVNEKRPGVSLKFNSLWYVRDGERFGGGGDASKDFEEMDLDDNQFDSPANGAKSAKSKGDELDDDLDSTPGKDSLEGADDELL